MTVSMKGHANYHPGNDIVCAAASMLACTFTAALEREKSAGALEHLEILRDSGDLLVRYTPTPDSQDRISVILETIVTGYALLAGKYPQNVFLGGAGDI